jgi:hypothetical protein
MDDLREIRQVMARTRRSVGGFAGQFMVLWGTIWFLGFLANQYLSTRALGWFWLVASALGGAASGWLGVRLSRRSGVQTSLWRPIILWMLALVAFVGLIVWLLALDSTRDIALLIVLVVALSYFQIGLFDRWTVSLVGAVLAVMAVITFRVLPDHFFLVMAFLSGGLLIGSGLWFMRSQE